MSDYTQGRMEPNHLDSLPNLNKIEEVLTKKPGTIQTGVGNGRDTRNCDGFSRILVLQSTKPTLQESSTDFHVIPKNSDIKRIV